MQPERPPEPWYSFLRELDGPIEHPLQLHCMGGFVIVHSYGLLRATADIDVLSVTPRTQSAELLDLAGKGSSLHTKFGIYLDVVTVATVPEGYQNRVAELFPGQWNRLRLFALEAHDLALSKLERNFERDRGDVQYLARSGFLDRTILRQRYQDELRPYILSRHSWHDQTLEMWIEAYLADSSGDR